MFLLYNFCIMLIRLALIALIFAIPAVPVQDKHPGDYDTQQAQRCTDQETASPLPAAKKDPRTYNENSTTEKPHGWHKLVTWPEGITAWAIMFTLGAIAWQAWETRKATTAGRRSARAALIQSRLQAAAMKQWVGVRLDNLHDFGKECNRIGQLLPSPNIDLLFQVINSTPYPFKIRHVKMGIDSTREPSLNNAAFFEDRWNATIPPLSSDKANVFTFRVPFTLSESEYASYVDGDLNLSVFGAVTFHPAVGSMETQSFALSYKCGRDRVTSLPVAPKLNPCKAFELKTQNEQDSEKKAK